MFFYTAYTTPSTYWFPSPSGVYTSRPDSWYYLGLAGVFVFIVVVLLATLYTTDLGKSELLYDATILFFTFGMLLFFISRVGLFLRS